jgi:response regulator RpfG family c-di-GMP phosphodiesterase
MTNPSTKIADHLLKIGKLSKEKHQGVLYHQKSMGGYIEDIILETGALDEDTLLKILAQVYRTRFVSTEKLKHAEIPRAVLKLVPQELATKLLVFPILYNQKNNELSIVSANPADLATEQAVSQAARVPRVRSFVARPASIKASIAKAYRGDIHSFAQLDREGFQEFHQMMDVYERNLLDEETMAASLVNEGSRVERVLSVEQMEDGAEREQKTTARVTGSSLDTTIEILRVSVSLLESSRAELAGHSVQTAHFVERMGRRIGLSPRDLSGITIAALIHDLGKGSPYHLTPFNVAEWDGHRTAAEKRYQTPERLFESVKLPDSTLSALRNMYERADGKGLPNGIRAKDIPLGAKILALSDTFSDLTSNSRNPFRRTLSTEEAMQILNKGKDTIFDKNLVDLFGIVVAGDDLKRQLLTGAQTVLIVDSDPEQSAILDLQLTSRGFRVRTAQTTQLANKILEEIPVNIIISEVDLEPFNGFEFKRRLNADPKVSDIPFMFFTSRSSDVEKGLSLGAQDYLIKPSTVEVIAAKIHKCLADKPNQASAGGVAGSLSEMSLPDLVQILSHGRKSGQLKLTIGQHVGEIHFSEGEIYNAMFDHLRGEEAFFAMVKHRDGSFVLNPDFRPDARVIQMTAEMLLLEGMRRLDEDNR